MRSTGIFLILLGALWFVFHAMGRQQYVMSIFGEYQMHAAIAALVVGPILLLLSFRKKKQPEEKT